MRIRNDQESSMEVDMAPLIDCVFLLLIFFLVASSLKQVDLQAEIPQAGPAGLAATVSGKPAVVHLTLGGTFRWDGKKYSLHKPKSLLEGVSRISGKGKNPRVEIRAHPEMTAGEVLLLVDALRLAGASTLDIRLDTDVK